MFENKIKNFLNSKLIKFNLKIVGHNTGNPLDFTDKGLDPISALYLAGQNQMIMNLDLNLGRTNRWFDMSESSLDPAIFAIRTALEKKLSGNELFHDIFHTLKENQASTIFDNAAKYLDLDTDQSKVLDTYPWWAEVKPWDNRSMENMLKFSAYEVKKNRASNGMYIKSNDPYEIMTEDLKNSLNSHARQYANITEQIRKNGFKYGSEFGYVSAEILIDKNIIRWKLGGEGNHRAAAASALGLKSIPVLISKIIRLDELEYWPNVKLGTFTKEQATKIFYSIFDARPSKIYNEWIEKKG